MAIWKELNRRDFLRGSAGVAAGILATACAPTASAPEAEADAEDMPEKMEIELAFSHWWGDYFGDVTQMIPIFTEKTGIKVQEHPSPFGGYHDKLLTQLVGGTAPDAFLADTFFNGTFFPSGLWAPLDEAINLTDLDIDKFAIDPWVETSYEGTVYALSIFLQEAQLIWINKAMADETGIELPVWGTPEFDTWRWDDFHNFVMAGTQRKDDGMIEQYGWGQVYSSMWWGPHSWIHQNGGELFDEGIWTYQETETLIHEPQFVEMMDRLLGLTTRDKVGPTMAAEEVVEGGTYRSQLAMCKLGTSAFVDNVLDFEQYVIHLPWTVQKSHGIGANHNAANASSDHLEEAIQLVIMMATDWEMQQQYTNLAGQSPYETVAHIEAAPEGPAKDVDLMAISRIEGMSTIPENTTPFAWRCGWYGIEPFVFRDRMAEAMQEVLLGEKTTQEAMDDAKAEFDAHLADTRS